jgi:hypothetical protein
MAIWRPPKGLLEQAKAAAGESGSLDLASSPSLNLFTSVDAIGASSSGMADKGFDERLLFTPHETLVPPDEELLPFDFHTPFSTMTGFVHESTDSLYVSDLSWHRDVDFGTVYATNLI